MGDSLQSTSPCFVRIDYGTGANSSTNGLKVQIGTGSNGSGTLTGNTSTQQTLTGSNTGTPASSTFCFTSGSSSRICLFFWGDDTTTFHDFVVVIERDRDAAGAETAVGMGIITMRGTTTTFQQFVPQPAQGAVPASETKLLSFLGTNTSSSGTNKVTICPLRHAFGALRNPGISVMIHAKGDFLSGILYTRTIYGVSHSYLAHNVNWAAGTHQQSTTTVGVMQLWE
jgi:hypothetical protein